MIQKTSIGEIQKHQMVDVIANSPEKFKQILEWDGILVSDLIDQLRVEENYDQVLSAGQGSGASGSFFFFTKCRRFIIKTLRRDEKTVLMNMLDDFCKHITYSNNESLLARIYGVYTIKTTKYADIDLIIMQNTSLVLNKKARTFEFDLKGSLKGRNTKFNPYQCGK